MCQGLAEGINNFALTQQHAKTESFKSADDECVVLQPETQQRDRDRKWKRNTLLGGEEAVSSLRRENSVTLVPLSSDLNSCCCHSESQAREMKAEDRLANGGDVVCSILRPQKTANTSLSSNRDSKGGLEDRSDPLYKFRASVRSIQECTILL